MKKKYYNAIIEFNKKCNVRNKYYANIIYSCLPLDSISNKRIIVSKNTL